MHAQKRVHTTRTFFLQGRAGRCLFSFAECGGKVRCQHRAQIYLPESLRYLCSSSIPTESMDRCKTRGSLTTTLVEVESRARVRAREWTHTAGKIGIHTGESLSQA
jgi:hypothetical protein